MNKNIKLDINYDLLDDRMLFPMYPAISVAWRTLRGIKIKHVLYGRY